MAHARRRKKNRPPFKFEILGLRKRRSWGLPVYGARRPPTARRLSQPGETCTPGLTSSPGAANPRRTPFPPEHLHPDAHSPRLVAVSCLFVVYLYTSWLRVFLLSTLLLQCLSDARYSLTNLHSSAVKRAPRLRRNICTDISKSIVIVNILLLLILSVSADLVQCARDVESTKAVSARASFVAFVHVSGNRVSATLRTTLLARTHVKTRLLCPIKTESRSVLCALPRRSTSALSRQPPSEKTPFSVRHALPFKRRAARLSCHDRHINGAFDLREPDRQRPIAGAAREADVTRILSP